MLDCAFQIILLPFYCFSFPPSTSRFKFMLWLYLGQEHRRCCRKMYSYRDFKLKLQVRNQQFRMKIIVLLSKYRFQFQSFCFVNVAQVSMKSLNLPIELIFYYLRFSFPPSSFRKSQGSEKKGGKIKWIIHKFTSISKQCRKQKRKRKNEIEPKVGKIFWNWVSWCFFSVRLNEDFCLKPFVANFERF